MNVEFFKFAEIASYATSKVAHIHAHTSVRTLVANESIEIALDCVTKERERERVWVGIYIGAGVRRIHFPGYQLSRPGTMTFSVARI